MSDNSISDEFQGEDIDANDVDWKSTAETLQAYVDSIKGATGLIIEAGDGKPWRVIVTDATDTVLVEIPLVGANLERLKALPTIDEHPPLKSYKIGEYVEVIKNGDWHKGRVSGVEKGFNVLIYVDTERGPVTVGGPRLIRKVA